MTITITREKLVEMSALEDALYERGRVWFEATKPEQHGRYTGVRYYRGRMPDNTLVENFDINYRIPGCCGDPDEHYSYEVEVDDFLSDDFIGREQAKMLEAKKQSEAAATAKAESDKAAAEAVELAEFNRLKAKFGG